jgi:ParB family chromosome partitioning protein
MAKTVQKITLSASRDIPFNKLVLSQANVRHVKAGVSIEELAEDIARRTLLQSLTVRPVLDEDGVETGLFEIPAGGRRYRALELLVKQKRLARTALIPCVVRTDGIAEEDSLAENVQRAPLHALDQFRAFLALREKGQSEEEIAAAFFVSVAVVKQRLRLAAVSPKLLDLYAADGMTLDQLMAFTVSPDHERQEQVWEALQRSYNKEPFNIRRMLTEGAVRASDKRARYVGEEYVAAGGAVMRDLFATDHGGWLQDVALLERLVAEKLQRDADPVRAESWKWVEVATEFPYGLSHDLRRITGAQAPPSDEDAASLATLKAEAEEIETKYEAAEELSEEVDRRLGEIEEAIAAIEERPMVYDAADIARAGAFVSIDASGRLRIERGYVRPEDEPPVDAVESEQSHRSDSPEPQAMAADARQVVTAQPEPAEEEDGIRPLSDKLLGELTAHRTLALRDVVGGDPATAYLAVLHVLCLKLFYRYGFDSCLEIEARSAILNAQAPGLGDTPLAACIDARHRSWAEQLPKEPADLWDALAGLDVDSQQALFAHCVGLTINAVHETWNRRVKPIAHAGRLAEAVSLDMTAVGWAPTAESYFGRVTKARILEAVREAKGATHAERIAHLKKGEMAAEAERLLAGSGWLPEPLRTPGQIANPEVDTSSAEAATTDQHAVAAE